jgi:hypothetical protein
MRQPRTTFRFRVTPGPRAAIPLTRTPRLLHSGTTAAPHEYFDQTRKLRGSLCFAEELPRYEAGDRVAVYPTDLNTLS